MFDIKVDMKLKGRGLNCHPGFHLTKIPVSLFVSLNPFCYEPESPDWSITGHSRSFNSLAVEEIVHIYVIMCSEVMCIISVSYSTSLYGGQVVIYSTLWGAP